MSDVIQATCLCKNIVLEVQEIASGFTACHCDMCKRWGGIWVAVKCEGVTINEPDQVLRYQSSSWAERGSCKTCGSHLFYRAINEETHFVPLGLFPASVDFEFTRQIFIDRKPDYYCFSDTTRNLTEAELFEEVRANMQQKGDGNDR